MKRVRKCVFPVAGMGSRFLPATKASPKEMMPVVDKPLIQYAVEEAVAAGMTTFAVPDLSHTQLDAFEGVTPHVYDSLHSVLAFLRGESLT